MSRPIRVLAIDDDSLIQKIIAKCLKDEYEVLAALSGTEALAIVEDVQPDIIILDIEMPGMSGFDTCRKLKDHTALKDTPIIFISSRTDIRSRLIGFELGATDFITKPFQGEELLGKVKSLGKLVHSRDNFEEQVRYANHTAFTALKGTSDLGVSIAYIETSFNIHSIDDLAQNFLQTVNQLGLNCCLMIKLAAETVHFSNDDAFISPIEKDVMETIHATSNRFTDFGRRTQINYDKVALLIKNMPVDKPESYGRFKDFLPTMLGATDARVKSIETESALIEQTKNLTASFEAVRETLGTVGVNLKMSQESVVDLLKRMLDELEVHVPSMGLDDDQEKYLMQTIDRTVVETEGIIDSSKQNNLAFDSVSRLLSFLVEKQQEMLKNMASKRDLHLHDEGEENIDLTEVSRPGEVDLF